jgi:hypothetical protein
MKVIYAHAESPELKQTVFELILECKQSIPCLCGVAGRKVRSVKPMNL